MLSRVFQLSAELGSVDALDTDQEVAMAILSGLLRRLEHQFVVIDAVSDDGTRTMELLKSHFIQEEQQMYYRIPTSPLNDLTLVNRPLDPK